MVYLKYVTKLEKINYCTLFKALEKHRKKKTLKYVYRDAPGATQAVSVKIL